MNEDIKILREAAQTILDNRKNNPGPRCFDQAIDRFQMACQPERILRMLEEAECALDLELALRKISYMTHLAEEEIGQGLIGGGTEQLASIRDEINRALKVNT